MAPAIEVADLDALAFDFYGTLVRLDRVVERCAALATAELASRWRARQIQYALLVSLMGRYQDFWTLTELALRQVARELQLDLDAAQRTELLQAWLDLEPFAEVRSALERLQTRPLFILSNGTPGMIAPVLERHGLRGFFREILSAEAVRIYKPAPAVYALVETQAGFRRDRVLFVSANGWDVVGAAQAGLRTCYLNRTGLPPDPLGPEPDLTASHLGELATTLAP